MLGFEGKVVQPFLKLPFTQLRTRGSRVYIKRQSDTGGKKTDR